MTSRRVDVDRAAAVRQAMIELVAERGLHGTAMSAVAARAGVATGTIYVHYADKEALILAVHREVKHDLGVAATTGWDLTAAPMDRFLGVWHRVHAHLVAHPEHSSFLLQLEASPYARAAQEVHDEVVEVWSVAADDLGDVLVDLPDDLLYDLAFGPAVALAARTATDAITLDAVARACWRAISR